MSDDWEQFQAEMADVTPLKQKQTVVDTATRPNTPGLQARRRAAVDIAKQGGAGLSSGDQIEMVKPWDFLEFKRDGVQEGVYRKLRLGKYDIESRLDLHRMTVDQARKALATFIADAYRYDLRTLIISHGKGEGREKPALLKSCVNHWLRELDEVLAFHSAQRHHGGVGATYVLLRKSSESSLKTKQAYRGK